MNHTVRAVVITEYGMVPTVEDWPTPVAGAGQSLIRFEAGGLNPADLAIASGRFYMPLPDPPCVAGVEAVGIIMESERYPIGTRVWSLGITGRFSEVFAAPDDRLVVVIVRVGKRDEDIYRNL